ncbi:hypothetical protein [Streptomyces sp. CC224B]|uniref:hypothetical protein n=1 Tax=Streptomyces sp. CC224B TaxID=3044571 RepID=UPI0024A83FA0|nr:hypothetical protein [Streptomyces sp. CC224B]
MVRARGAVSGAGAAAGKPVAVVVTGGVRGPRDPAGPEPGRQVGRARATASFSRVTASARGSSSRASAGFGSPGRTAYGR